MMAETKKKKSSTAQEKAKDPNARNGFFIDVYDVVRQIPKGRVSSYGAIAQYLGLKRSARMVGWAMSVSHTVKPKVPAHRVVNAAGVLTGKFHFSDIHQMENLLQKEGLRIQNDTVQDFKNVFWDPSIELAL